MVALRYLKYTHDLSDETIETGWVENPYWQYFSGIKYFEHELTCDPSSMTHRRKPLSFTPEKKNKEWLCGHRNNVVGFPGENHNKQIP